MKRTARALLVVALGACCAFNACNVLAQGDALQGLDSVAAERTRIETERTRESDFYARQEAECYQRFAVNSCLSNVNSQRRAMLADLKRQEQVLNDAQRMQRAAAQLQLTEEKAQEKLQKDAEAAQTDNAASQAQRQQEQDVKKADHAAKSQGASSVPRTKAPATATDSTSARSDYERKQQDAAQRKREVEKRRREKAVSPPLKPLPVPP